MSHTKERILRGKPSPVRNVGRQTLDRRTLLRGSLAGVSTALALPVLDIMLNDGGNALAAPSGRKQDQEALPLRFGVFYWGGGVTHQYWVPTKTGTGAAWELSECLQPFGPTLKPYLTMVTGTNHKESSPGHIPARGVVLSSSHDLDWMEAKVGRGFRGQNMPEPSIDSLVSEHWRGHTLFDWVGVGICRKGPYRSNSSWKRGGRTYNRHEPSPQRLFDRLFQYEPNAGEKPSMLKLTTALHTSMLDGLLDETRKLQRGLGYQDRDRLESHMEGLRSVEWRLQERERLKDNPRVIQCAAPERPMRADYGDNTGHEEKEAKSQVMSDILATAIACDLTRVFSYEWSATQSHTVYWETGARMEHHPMNHAVGDSHEYARTITFIMKNYARLAEALRAKTEGDGNVLDRTLIYGTSEHASAKRHNYKDHPILLVGKAGGRIRTDLHYREACDWNEKSPRVLLSATRAMGLPVARLGQDEGPEPRAVTEGLSEIEA